MSAVIKTKQRAEYSATTELAILRRTVNSRKVAEAAELYFLCRSSVKRVFNGADRREDTKCPLLGLKAKAAL